MEEKTRLWEKLRQLSYQEICCKAQGLYAILTEAFEKYSQASASGTDGETFYYDPELFFERYDKEGLRAVNRLFLHTLFHVLYLHMAENPGTDKEAELWNLSCDLVVEYTIDCMHLESLTGTLKPSAQRICAQLWQGEGSLSAEQIYEKLKVQNPDADRIKSLQKLFVRDCHRYWKMPEHEKIEKLLVKISCLSKTFGEGQKTGTGRRGMEAGDREEWYEVQEQRKRAYHRFLKNFMIQREELQMDLESFDYIPYLYGLSHYKNLPIIEPLEYTETRKLEELVIALDTSSSCTRETVQRFLQETYAVLGRQEDFFKKINVHIIQCDCYIQEDVVVTCEREWKNYLKHIRIQGRGGTDFRPVFRYVEELREKGSLKNLKGLLYFTDGDGIYPTVKPDYETVFLLMREPPKETNVPLWAKILYMDERNQGEKR